jgi:heme/copper-type cytochrome/quinol oxidase subunit 1
VWRKGWWPYVWHQYITSTDHKKIGIMYIVLALLMLVRGFADAIMMRASSRWRSALAGLFAARTLQPDLLRARARS